MHSVFGIRSKRIKTRGYIVKKDPFISVLSYIIHFKAGLNIPRKKNVFQKK